MATLTSQKISVAFPNDVSTFLNKRAKRNNMSLPETILAIVVDSMENKEDKINPKKKQYLVERAEKNEATSSRLYTHEEVMARFR